MDRIDLVKQKISEPPAMGRCAAISLLSLLCFFSGSSGKGKPEGKSWIIRIMSTCDKKFPESGVLPFASISLKAKNNLKFSFDHDSDADSDADSDGVAVAMGMGIAMGIVMKPR